MRSPAETRFCEMPAGAGEDEFHDGIVPWNGPGSGAPQREALRAELLEVMQRALSDLSPTPRGLVVGFYFHGKTVAELAAEYGRTPKAVQEALRRARQRLKRYLDRCGISAEDILNRG